MLLLILAMQWTHRNRLQLTCSPKQPTVKLRRRGDTFHRFPGPEQSPKDPAERVLPPRRLLRPLIIV
jgi:hypothetical protein